MYQAPCDWQGSLGSPAVPPPCSGCSIKVPYGEAMWLSKGFHSAYHNDSHRRFQKAVRSFMQTVVKPNALACEENGKRASQEVFDALA
jgi:hypothetical protein